MSLAVPNLELLVVVGFEIATFLRFDVNFEVSRFLAL